MSDLMKYNAIMPRDDDDYHLWYDSLKGFRLYIRGVGNCGFNQEAEVLFQIERERIIKLLDIWDCNNDRCDCDSINDCFYRQQLIKLIKGENK